jgi:hypothetical protein
LALTLSATVAVGDVERGVDIGLIFPDPIVVVCTTERCLLRARSFPTVRVTLRRRVPWIHRLDGISGFFSLLSDFCVEFGERPSVQPTIHERAKVQLLPDVPKVLQHNYRMLDLPCAFDY